MIAMPVALMTLLLGAQPAGSRAAPQAASAGQRGSQPRPQPAPVTPEPAPAPLVLIAPADVPLVEPDPAPVALVELGPAPSVEPAPELVRDQLVELGPAPSVEPAPELVRDQLVELGPAPSVEPAPALTADALADRLSPDAVSQPLALALALGRLGLLPLLSRAGTEPRRPTLLRSEALRPAEERFLAGDDLADPLPEPEATAAATAGAKARPTRRLGRGPVAPPVLSADALSRHFEEPRDALSAGVCPGLAGEPFAIRGHVFTSRWIERTLHGVIANHCLSKTYQDITSLDGGTVGISHFASGSLDTLYSLMDQPRYFGAHAGHVPARPYQLQWWREGMQRFLRSPEARGVQFRAWRTFISPALAAALAHGWSTDRELAIAASIANSLGSGGFQVLAQQNHWDAEHTLRVYAGRTAHKERRRVRLNREFPAEGLGAPAAALASAQGRADLATASR